MRSTTRRVDDDCLQELRWLCDRRDLPEAHRDLAAWLPKWSGKYSKRTGWVEGNIDEMLTFYRLLRQHHKHLKSTNMLEPSRRSNAAPMSCGFFPTARVVCGWCARSPSKPTRTGLEQNRYLNMDDLRERKKEALRSAA